MKETGKDKYVIDEADSWLDKSEIRGDTRWRTMNVPRRVLTVLQA